MIIKFENIIIIYIVLPYNHYISTITLYNKKFFAMKVINF